MMGIDLSVKGVAKAIGLTIVLATAAAAAGALIAAGVDMVSPGLGIKLKSWTPFK